MTPYERLEFKGWTETDSGCWEFNGGLRDGYGYVSIRGVSLVATRVMYEHHFGPIPKNLLVRHKCDNPPCVNPDHLEVGTVRDNTQDMLDRGRHTPPRGETNGQSKLTAEQVIEMRGLQAAGVSYHALAERFGVSVSCVSSVVNRQRWRHV